MNKSPKLKIKFKSKNQRTYINYCVLDYYNYFLKINALAVIMDNEFFMIRLILILIIFITIYI